MSFEINGKLYRIEDTRQVSANFSAREFVLVSEEQYPQYIKFQLVQDKCGIIDNYREGDRVRVSFDLRGRESNGKIWTNINAWRVDYNNEEAPVFEPREPRENRGGDRGGRGGRRDDRGPRHNNNNSNDSSDDVPF